MRGFGAGASAIRLPGFADFQQVAVGIAGKVIEAIQAGKIRKLVVMAGCDGRQKDRAYYIDYRYNKLPLGSIDGIPRVLDAGQCNDSYSLAKVAIELAKTLEVGINDLPILYNIAWYEQKAVIVLLALLSLGVKDIHLGPTLPAFLSPNVARVLVENFGIAPISGVEEDGLFNYPKRFGQISGSSCKTCSHLLFVFQRLACGTVALFDHFLGQGKFHEMNMADPGTDKQVGAVQLEPRCGDLPFHNTQGVAEYIKDVRHRLAIHPCPYRV